MVTDTRVPWHRLSPATRYRGTRSRSDSRLADTDRPSYIEIYISPRGDRSHRRQSLLAFPGREVALEREGSTCAAPAAPGLWEVVPPPPCSASSPGQSCWGSPTPRAINLPVEVGWGAGTRGEVHPRSYLRCPQPPRRKVAALPLPISSATHGARGLHQLGLAKR